MAPRDTETGDQSRPSSQSALEQFGSGLTESVSSPLSGAAELFGGPRSSRATGESSTAHDAGAMLGSAVVFVATTAAVRRFLPGAGKLAPILAGGLLGGASSTEHNTIGERLQNAAIGAGTVSLLELGPVGLSRLGVKGPMSQVAISGVAAGGFHVQADSWAHKGQFASAADTLLSGGIWAGTGLAFTAGGQLLKRPPGQLTETQPSQPAPGTYYGRFTDLPGLEIGSPATAGSKLNVATGSELQQMYAAARESIGRAEVLAQGAGGMEGRFGTVFGVSADGKLMTANHVVKGAVDITVFDSNMRTHSARVIAASDSMDLAVLQLTNKASFSAFKPLALGDGTADGVLAAFGHPNGWRELYAAPGRPIFSPRPNMAQRYSMHGQEGLSGAPIIADGAVQSVFIQGARNTNYESIGAPIKQARTLLDSIKVPQAANDPVFAPGKPKLNLRLIRSFRINDADAAQANLEKMFGSRFASELPAEFFHSKVKTVDTESGALTMKMQYLPSEHQVVINPIALDGKPIAPDALWANSKLPIKNARLEVNLGADGKPRTMVSSDDPAGVLQQGFNYRGEDNYLATLQQRTVPTWKQVLDRGVPDSLNWLKRYAGM